MWDNKFKGRYVLIEPTDYCNCDCIMCTRALLGVENPHNVPKGFMELATFKRIIDSLKFGEEPLAIKLFWIGESLLHPDFRAMLEYASARIKDENAYIDLHTNGLLLTKELSDYILSLGAALPRITFSLDAFSEATHRKIRRGGALSRAVENIKHLIREREALHLLFPRVILQFIIMDQNAHEAEAFCRFWTAFLRATVQRDLASAWPLLSNPRRLELLREHGLLERFNSYEA
jgi:MoaA/NifB/PqqE/SkfB family radical SAM enzyme